MASLDKKLTREKPCGHPNTSSGQFVGDLCPECGCTYFKCSNCNFLVTADAPPEVCPECEQSCMFIDVSCYTPDCGGPGKVDPRLLT